MSFPSSMQIPGVTWDLAGMKRGTKLKGQCNGGLLATAATAAQWGGGYTVASWADGSILILEGMMTGLGVLKESRIRGRCRKGPQEEYCGARMPCFSI